MSQLLEKLKSNPSIVLGKKEESKESELEVSSLAPDFLYSTELKKLASMGFEEIKVKQALLMARGDIN